MRTLNPTSREPTASNLPSRRARFAQKTERAESAPACERGRCAVDYQRCPVHLTHDPAEISEQVRAETRFDQWAPAVRGEDYVKQDVAKGVGHDSYPSGASLFLVRSTPRLAPWAALLRRLAADPTRFL
jgi:hypothetical protein